VPVWASLQRLRAVGLDPRVPTSLVVDLDVDKRACPAPLVLKRVYSSDPRSKLCAVAKLLGDPIAGFAIIPPVLPRALLGAGAAAYASWTSSQQAWYHELVTQARDSGDLVRELGSTSEQRGAALDALFALIRPAALKQLWPEQELTSDWVDILTVPSAPLSDRTRSVRRAVGNGQPPVMVPETSIRMRLCCATAEVAYVVAGCIANYALLSREVPEAAQRLRGILGGASSGSSPDAATSVSESDSSDGDGEWQTYRSSREAARQRRRVASRTKQLTAFVASELSAPRFKVDSAKPLLQLATRVSMRTWQNHYAECFVSNWQSVGCPDDFDQTHPAFERVTASLVALCDAAAARWVLRSQVGGTLVSLFVRDDYFVHLPRLNAVLREVPGLQGAALRVVCEAHPRRLRGERPTFVDRRRYCLTPEAVSASGRSAPSSPSQPVRVPGTLAPPAWAAAMSAARLVAPPFARRPAPTAPIDHRPRKDQRSAPSAAPSLAPTWPAVTPVTVAPNQPAAPSWEARMASLEARLDGLQNNFQAFCGSVRDLPRQIAGMQRAFDQQRASPPPSSPPSSNPALPTTTPTTHVAHGGVPGPDAAIAALYKRVDSQKLQLDKLTDLCSSQRAQMDSQREYMDRMFDFLGRLDARIGQLTGMAPLARPGETLMSDVPAASDHHSSSSVVAAAQQ
jgi:hypothetical protein